ncbi:MAG: polynucleotide adenylyltransferase PcnB [Polyangia bacterium]|jgi:poly(A) polymerase
MQIRPDQIDPDAAKVVERLLQSKHEAYLVGGCVRDLLLGRKPKDFDVATSAKPNELRRLFRNCRIIGRRFRLAHIFFGRKIIETSTFRANPRAAVDDQGGNGNGSDAKDLLIRHDNEFGSAVEDARRRDFTINGLFYDISTGQVIDHVNGMVDLEARLVRTIGDPDIRFREDPIRILRAVKFAARCDLTIEPETYRRMMEHKGEIAKCAQARVSEEFFRLLRAGAARRSFELLLGTGLLAVLSPDLARALQQEPADEAARVRLARFWAYLAAVDRSTTSREETPSDALVLATLLLPPLRDALHPDSTAFPDLGQLVLQSAQSIVEQLKASRRDAELSRQILLATRYLFPSSNRQRPNLESRDFYQDALRLVEIVTDAESSNPALAGRPLLAPEGSAVAVADEALPADLQPSLDRSRRRRGRRDRRLAQPSAPLRAGELPPSAPPREVPAAGLAPDLRSPGLTPIPGLTDLLRPVSRRPAFLGAGPFGSRWGARAD